MKTIILDHDIGTNPDDFFALLMLLNSREINLPLVISGNNHPLERAKFAKKIIEQHGRENVVVASGEQMGHIDFSAQEYIEEYESEICTDYKVEIKKVLDNNNDVTYLCIQGVSNLASFLKENPTYKDTFEIIHMGMSVKEGGEFVAGGTNMEGDSMSAMSLYKMGLKNFKVVGSHTTINDSIRVESKTKLYQKIANSNNSNHRMLISHLNEYNKRRGIWPALHDPLTTSVALGKDFVNFEEIYVDFDDKGYYRKGSETKVICSKKEINKPEEFMDFCVSSI